MEFIAVFKNEYECDSAYRYLTQMLASKKSIQLNEIYTTVWRFQGYFLDLEKKLSNKTCKNLNNKIFNSNEITCRIDKHNKCQLIITIPVKEEIGDGGKRISYGEGLAEREPSDGKGRFDLISPFALTRIAKWYELGSKKYKDRNWEKGMPFSRYVDSAFRHLVKFMMGMNDEDHLAAVAWNVMAIMHHEELGQGNDLDNLPHYFLGYSPVIKEERKEETNEIQ